MFNEGAPTMTRQKQLYDHMLATVHDVQHFIDRSQKGLRATANARKK